MASSQRRPARRANKHLMSRQYTSSFSGVDWGGFLSGSMRSTARHRESDFSVGTESIDIPSLGSASNRGGDGGSGNKKTTNAAAALSREDGCPDEESVGSKMLVEQILQETDQMARRPPLWKGVKNLYAPEKKKQRKQQQRVSFSLNVEEDGDGKDGDERIDIAKSGEGNDEKESEEVGVSTSTSKRCVAITVLTIVVSAVVCFIAIPRNGQGVMYEQQQQQRGQEMLELAEQITIACGESSLLLRSSKSKSSTTGIIDAKSGMATCQELCHNHMCCVEEEEEYSCKSDVTKDCAVYVGCEALIDDNFW
eukprot:scaffold2631_cov142-Skeletonema_menzelii.AAC.4